jgi:hypothetical protein
MIAERQPEDCRVDGNKVCLGGMEWLHEIERDLYEVAVNRDGLWHLKEAAAARYDREELYEKVWAQPIQTLAKEYGVSDVALAKACKRRRVPVPGRGHWAKKLGNRCQTDRHYPWADKPHVVKSCAAFSNSARFKRLIPHGTRSGYISTTAAAAGNVEHLLRLSA